MKTSLLVVSLLISGPAMGQFWKPADDITTAVGTPTPHDPTRQGIVVHKSSSGLTLSREPVAQISRPIAEDFDEKTSMALADACLSAFRPAFFDPPSARLEGYQTYRMPNETVGIVVRVNGKNRFGGYVGAKPYRCYKENGRWQAKSGDW
jgi:hypothetical protein